MDRRALLRGLAALATTGTLAGCTNNAEVPVTAPDGPLNIREQPNEGTDRDRERTEPEDSTPTPTPERGLEIVNQSIQLLAGNDGNLVVSLVVRNRSRGQETALVEIAIDGTSDDYLGQEFVRLAGGEEATVEMAFPIEYDRYSSLVNDISWNLVQQTPETPIETPTESPTSTATESPAPTQSESPTGTPTERPTGTPTENPTETSTE